MSHFIRCMLDICDLSIPDCRCCHEILIDVHYVARYSQVGKVIEVLLGFAARGSRD